jgi:hypothetical protein
MAELTAHDFELKVVSGDGDTADYRINGQVSCPTPGYSFDVEPYPEGFPPSDERAVFELKTNEPTDPQAEVITDTPVNHPFTDSNKLQTVTIYLRGEFRTEDGSDQITLNVMV